MPESQHGTSEARGQQPEVSIRRKRCIRRGSFEAVCTTRSATAHLYNPPPLGSPRGSEDCLTTPLARRALQQKAHRKPDQAPTKRRN